MLTRKVHSHEVNRVVDKGEHWPDGVTVPATMNIPLSYDGGRDKKKNRRKPGFPIIILPLACLSVGLVLLWWSSGQEKGLRSPTLEVQNRRSQMNRADAYPMFSSFVCGDLLSGACNGDLCRVEKYDYSTIPWSKLKTEQIFSFDEETGTYKSAVVGWDSTGDSTGQLAKLNQMLYDAPDSSLCSNPLCRLGPAGDGGWPVCIDDSHMQRPRCVIYSIGVNYQPFFSVAAAALGCDVFMYDHTLTPDMEKVIKNMHENLHFYSLGLSDVSNSFKKLMSLPDMMKEHDHDYIDILKIDCEGCEWPVFESFVKKYPNLLQNVGQLLIELHIRENMKLKDMDALIAIIDHVFGKHGFRVAYRHMNAWGVLDGFRYRKMFNDPKIVEGQDEHVTDFAFWEVVLLRKK